MSHSVFEFLLDLEIAKAQRLQYCVSVVSLRPDQDASRDEEALTRAATAIVQEVRATDVVAMIPPDILTLMVIDADTRAIPSIVNRITGRLHGVGQPDAEETTWSVGASCYPNTVTETKDVERQATDLMALARHDGGDRLYLPV